AVRVVSSRGAGVGAGDVSGASGASDSSLLGGCLQPTRRIAATRTTPSPCANRLARCSSIAGFVLGGLVGFVVERIIVCVRGILWERAVVDSVCGSTGLRVPFDLRQQLNEEGWEVVDPDK